MSHDHHHHHDEHAGIDRRSFLKLAGFSFGAFVAGCQEGKIEKAIPFLVQPEEVTPGLAYWYSTTCGGCNAACGVLAKNRDGRPIKLEGNPEHPLSQGGLCAIGQASILSLYDSQRLRMPVVNGVEVSWQECDEAIEKALSTHGASGVRLLTGTVASPTLRSSIKQFLARFPDSKHIQYDAISYSGILDAHTVTHGRRVLPRFKFDRAKRVVSFAADFLGTWISPVEFTAGYRAGRTLEGTPPKFSRHIQIESGLTLTGSNADERIAVAPHEMAACIKSLMISLLRRSGQQIREIVDVSCGDRIEAIAGELWDHRGQSLVVCGINEPALQLMVNVINQTIESYGSTLDIVRPSLQVQGDDTGLHSLIKEIEQGGVGVLITAGCNPVYDLPGSQSLAENIRRIPARIAITDRIDETASVAQFVCPLPHALESWNDHEPVDGLVSITQPTIQPLRQCRTVIENLARWTGDNRTTYELIREEWQVLHKRSGSPSFEEFWTNTLTRGYAELTPQTPKLDFHSTAVAAALGLDVRAREPQGFSLVIQPSLTMLDGRHAHNPWLQELPDPVTKIVWDNYASLSIGSARRLGVEEGDIVAVSTDDGVRVELPVHIQPGHFDGAITVYLGYGRKGTDRFTDIGPKWIQSRPTVEKGKPVGVNVAPLLLFTQNGIAYHGRAISVTATGRKHDLVATQEYHSLHDPDLLGKSTGHRRPIVQEASLAAYIANPAAGSGHRHEIVSMWSDDHAYKGHHWGMAVDLTACTGCSACVVSCQAENNIPVVGRDEVQRNREMTWIRIDRYYDESNGRFNVSHQPMMCQHCGNAPCETVCPVLATVHNDEGLNQQVYNRCVGTRYCANNCPYKIRRFNWFKYDRGDDMQRMVLNPDVTVRERGVMEKCSFCVQRIQLAKIDAKQEGRPLRDGDIQPACVQSCPAKAITFGDMNDAESNLVKKMTNPRYYRVLEELGVKPSVGYMTLIHDRPEEKEAAHG